MIKISVVDKGQNKQNSLVNNMYKVMKWSCSHLQMSIQLTGNLCNINERVCLVPVYAPEKYVFTGFQSFLLRLCQ